MTMLSKNNTNKFGGLKISHIDSNCLEEIQQFITEWENPDSHVALNTSGSTGEKKIIRAQKKHLIESARMTGNFFGFTPEKTVLICLPLSFIAGKMMVIRSLTYDMHVVLCQPNNPFEYPDVLPIDFAAMTPYQYEKALLEFPSQLMKIKTVLLGGAAIAESLKNKIVLNNQRVFHSYGMTDTYSHVALKQIDNQDHPFQFLEGISGKKASDNTLILHAPKLGIETLKTNDIVHIIDNTHFDFLGRIDFVVNSGGIKLHPEELEKKLGVLDWEFNYFFFGLPDETLGEKLVLFVESQHVVELNAFGNLLTKYELPKEVLFLERFEYTESGKINRNLTVKNYLS